MESDKDLKNKKVETYADDMAKTISGGQGGLIKKIIHEEEEKEALKRNISPESKKNKLFMTISVVLLVLAISLLVYLFISKKSSETAGIAPQFTPLIFTDKTDFQVIDGLLKEKIADNAFAKVKNTKVRVGGIEGVYLTENKKVIGFKRFIALLKNNIILDKVELFDNNFLLGVVNKLDFLADERDSVSSKNFFILLKAKSFTDIFGVMRDWESKMMYDLHGFFGVNISPTTNYLFTKNFEDGFVKNKNSRVLKDNNGEIVLMYVFIDDSSIVITNSEVATDEIIDRIFTSQVKK